MYEQEGEDEQVVKIVQLTQQVKALLEGSLGIVVESNTQDLFDSGALDSLSFVNLLVELEAAYGITIALDELDFDEFSTVAGIAGYLARARCSGIARAS